ncbi:50S ribosomal protein L34e [uncultured archaeon]|nr:50S ribosomal protein L34e [uncultured archaeon]
MVSPRERSTSFRVRIRRTPGGNKGRISKQGKPSKAHCALTHDILHGVPTMKRGQLTKLSKTQKRPERKFGGVLSHKILRTLVKEKVRLQEGSISESEVQPTHMKYIKMMRK